MCLLSGWLSRRLSSPRCLPSTGASASCRAPLVPLRITAIVIVIVVVVVVVIVVIVFIVVDDLPDQREQPSTPLLLLPFRLIVISVAVAASRWERGINSLIPSQRRGIEKGDHRATAAIAIATIATTIAAPPTASPAIIAISAAPSCWGGVYPSKIEGPTSLV